jgi:hypothetical protein
MTPRTRQTLAVAAVVVALAAIAGIAAIEGWLPLLAAGDTPASVASPALRVVGTAPPETLLPGESVVTDAPRSAPAAAPAPAPERKAAPQKPSYAQSPATRPSERRTRGLCANCGAVTAATFRDGDRRGPWEVRVQFDDGTRRTLRFPTDPGVRPGDRVLLSSGRLHRD